VNGTENINDFINRAQKPDTADKNLESFNMGCHYGGPTLNDEVDMPGSFNWNNTEVEVPRDPFPKPTGYSNMNDSLQIADHQQVGDVFDESSASINAYDQIFHYINQDVPLFPEDLLDSSIFTEQVTLSDPVRSNGQ